MAARTIRRRPGVAPPDQGRYRYRMLHGGGAELTLADTLAELIGALLPGYSSLLSAQERVEARRRHAIQAQVAAQAMANLDADLSACTPEELVVLMADRSRPVEITQWSAPVPLVLIDIDYAPIGLLPQPVAVPPGQILWLRPGTERDHLAALAELGIIAVADLGTPEGRA